MCLNRIMSKTISIALSFSAFISFSVMPVLAGDSFCPDHADFDKIYKEGAGEAKFLPSGSQDHDSAFWHGGAPGARADYFDKRENPAIISITGGTKHDLETAKSLLSKKQFVRAADTIRSRLLLITGMPNLSSDLFSGDIADGSIEDLKACHKFVKQNNVETLAPFLPLIEKAIGRAQCRGLSYNLTNTGFKFEKHAKYLEAKKMYQSALAIREKSIKADPRVVADSLVDLARLDREQGKFIDAKNKNDRAIAFYKSRPIPDDSQLKVALEANIWICNKLGQTQKANSFLAEYKKIR